MTQNFNRYNMSTKKNGDKKMMAPKILTYLRYQYKLCWIMVLGIKLCHGMEIPSATPMASSKTESIGIFH